ncbi:MAG TPA: bifunctional diguanylate cyclase/phosphodiesterase, partial [Rhodocyclaceae bacterium]|nr:bifunctional diguanylate cyclase/phosphodiesterase [Rhodocyclaceae bacterium]
PEPDAFSAEEVKLLEELVSNVSYGIQTLRMAIAGEVSERKLEFLENHDSLTGLPNRLLLRDRFSIAAATATRERTSIAICSLNLDNFKQINDSFGHACADQFLINAVSRLQQCLSETDTISRVVGDEFIALIPTGNDPTLIAITAQRIIDSFSEPLTANGHVAISSFSIGISIYPNDGTDFDELIKLADIALYKAKEAGRSAFRFFSQKMNVNLLERVTLQTQLHSAVKNAELCLHYQPQINTHTKQVIGAEALIRWQHPEMGLVSSAKFIPIAERSGLIIPIGEWVLQEACRQWQKWRLSQCFPQCTIAVNLSAIQFLRGDIVETVRKVLASTGLPPEYLELELTESILLQDIEGVVETLSALKRIGVQLSIDDFGTGYSSLAYLKRLDVDKLKIDKSFVDDMVTDPEAAAIVKAIIQLGHTLKLTTIAEGVEEPEQLALLDEYGCDEIQGYVFSRPLPADDFKKFCAC